MTTSLPVFRAGVRPLSGGLLLLVLMASWMALGCSLPGELQDPCRIERAEVQAARRLRESLIVRNVDNAAPTYRAALDRVRAADEALARCEVEVAATP